MIKMSFNTTEDLAEFLGIKRSIPNLSLMNTSRANEAVDTIVTGTLEYYLDYGQVIASTYTLYADGVALTETTDFTLDKDLGRITLATGKDVTYNTQALTAKYSHLNNGAQFITTDSELQDVLDRAISQINDEINTVFVDGTLATPAYVQVTNEKHSGQGGFNRAYYMDSYPLPDVSTTINGAITAEDATITVVSTNGFPETGVITIESNKIAYTGKSATTLTGCTNVLAHDDLLKVYPFCVEVSVTPQGTEPSWTVFEPKVDYDIDIVSGRIFLYTDDSSQLTSRYTYPQNHIPDRIRFNYIYGTNNIPADMKRVELMISATEIEDRRLHSYIINGISYDSSSINIDNAWIKETLMKYKSLKTSNI